MLKNIHQVIILLIFSILLREVLTKISLLFVLFGVGVIVLKIKMNKKVRTTTALVVFISYGFTYGKIIDPEVGLNFLTTVVMLKMLERESLRDEYMILFGLLLLVSAGSLFEKNIPYVLFFTISFFYLIKNFYSFLGQRIKIKEVFYISFWVFPLTFFLFFTIPRLLRPIPFQQSIIRPGEVGYTSDVIISDIENLEPNSSPVFNVELSRFVPMKDLYWRGNTLSYNDGWNWKEMLQDRQVGKPLLLFDKTNGIHQKIQLFTRPNFFIFLDYPKSLKFSHTVTSLGRSRTLPQDPWEWAQKYEVVSDLQDVITDEEVVKHYTNVSLSKKTKEEIRKIFTGRTVDEILDSIRTYFVNQNFIYTLSPGKSNSVMNFLKNKKGFCSHYASATALILRIKGIPTRLVSGFMGGSFNPYAGIYLITQNDAHVWVEVFDKGAWKRIDPTGWIAPERLSLGGVTFIQNADENIFNRSFVRSGIKFLIPVKLWFEHLDYKFYQWLEKMDYENQKSLLLRFNFSRRWLYSLIPIIITAFFVGYLLVFHLVLTPKIILPQNELWALFFKKMKKRGIYLSSVSIKECYFLINQSKDKAVAEVFQDLVKITFEHEGGDSKIKERIKKL